MVVSLGGRKLAFFAGGLHRWQGGRSELASTVTSSDSLRFDFVDHVMLIVHGDVVPDEGDWARMISVRNANRERIRSNLVVAPPRATINAAQRADIVQFIRETGTSIAVVTDSALIRGIARAVGFLGVQVRAFPPTDLAGALNFLVVPPSRHADWARRIEALKAQLATGAAQQKRA